MQSKCEFISYFTGDIFDCATYLTVSSQYFLAVLWYLKQKNLVNVIKNNSTRLAAMTKFLTRLDSSRMHTARLLTVSPSMHCSRGGCLVPGGAWSRGRVSARRGICPGGCLPRGVSAQGVTI